MKTQFSHSWQLTPSQAITLQRELAKRVIKEGTLSNVKRVAGVDISVNRKENVARGAVVILSYPQLEPIEIQVAERPIEYPYVPGLLTFREAPVILQACEQLSHTPDLMLVDGQGIAHPRRLGLAAHLGILLDCPTIGCAKSRLCGEHAPVWVERGENVDLLDGDEVIGAVLRTRTNVKPLYISIGHRIDLASAIQWVLNCSKGYRLPEPTRRAHQVAGGHIPGTGRRSETGNRRKGDARNPEPGTRN